MCYGCGVKGHKRSECPEKVASIRRSGQSWCKVVQGRVRTNPCKMTLDSAADQTVVRADLVKQPDYTGESSRVSDYYGCWREIPRAKVWIEIGKEYKFRHDVLVVPCDCPHEVLLGNDLEFFDELYRTANTDTHTTPQVKAITRAGARKQMEEEERNETLNKRDAAKPIPVNSEHGATQSNPQSSTKRMGKDCCSVPYVPEKAPLSIPPINASDCQNPVMDVEDDRVEEVGSREDKRIEVEGEVEREMNVQKDARGGERAEALDEDVEEDVEAEDYEEDMKINGMEKVGGENEINIPIPNMIVKRKS